MEDKNAWKLKNGTNERGKGLDWGSFWGVWRKWRSLLCVLLCC